MRDKRLNYFTVPETTMKKTVILFLSLLTLISLLASCSGETGTDDPDREPSVRTVNGETVFVLKSLTTETGVTLRGGRPFITSLKTESGAETVSKPTECPLPDLGPDYSWTYRDYKQYDDKKGGRGFILRFSCDELALTYHWSVVSRPDLPGPFEFFGEIINEGTVTHELAPGTLFSATVSGDTSPYAWTFSKESGVAEGYTLYWTDPKGVSFPGRGINRRILKSGTSAHAENSLHGGWNQNGLIPMMYLDFGGTRGVYFALEWTDGRLDAVGTDENGVTLSVHLGGTERRDGQTVYTFSTKLPPKGTFRVPPVYLGAYDGDVDDGSNVFKRWFLRYKAPANVYEDECEPLTQCDLQMVSSDAVRWGIESIKWDIAWWNEDGSWSRFDTLVPRNPAYLYWVGLEGAETLPEYTAKLKENGVSMTAYVLLRDLRVDDPGEPSSKGEGGHPEWFGMSSSNGMVADLGNEGCVAFFRDYLRNFFASNGVTTWRSDFEPIISTGDFGVKENRHGGKGSSDVSYWCTVGFGELVDYLTENVPGFRYESCSNGGSMKDLYTMTKASVVNCDDTGDYMSLHMSFYDASYCIHPAQIQLPTVTGSFIRGNDRSTDYSFDYLYGLRCSLVGGVMLNYHGEQQNEHETYWPYYLKLYRETMRPLIRNGNLYHILPRPDGVHWDGLEYYDPDSTAEISGMILLWKPSEKEGPQKTVTLRGLDPDANYKLTFEDRKEQNATYTGAQLMTDGLTVTIDGAFGSEMIWISKA